MAIPSGMVILLMRGACFKRHSFTVSWDEPLLNGGDNASRATKSSIRRLFMTGMIMLRIGVL